jgi:hypothetical protein
VKVAAYEEVGVHGDLSARARSLAHGAAWRLERMGGRETVTGSAKRLPSP